MPARLKRLIQALEKNEWIGEFASSDPCLYNVLLQAVIAKETAEAERGNPKVIATGNRILEDIRAGRSAGQRACTKVADAIRQYDAAYMGAERRGHALRKRYGKRRVKSVKAGDTSA